MKAAPEQQQRLLDIAEADAALARLNHRRATLPEAEEVVRLDGEIARLRDRVVAAETALGDLDREQRKAESDVDQVRTRSERDRARLDGGQVSSPKELEQLQSEIDSLQRRQSELEEVVLEVMERREAAESERTAAAAELAGAEGRRDTAADARGAAVVEIDSDRATERERRDRLAKEVPDDLLGLYDKLREQYGIGAAALHYGRCEGCKLALSTAELGRIRQAPADEVLRCDDCRRILVRTAESGL
ncbi:zinc ribbon domain-containing protein [Nocardiopsis coralliicola]